MNKQNSEATETIILAVDNGNGNMKTENTVFRTGIEFYNTEPIISKDYMRLGDKYFIVGESHMIYHADKTDNDDSYYLTAAAIVRELEYRGIDSARIHLVVGLPLSWCSAERKKELKEYYLKKPLMDVEYKQIRYHIELVEVDVLPQGVSAICGRYSLKGINMLVDIGNGTINTMQIVDGVPKENTVKTVRTGVGVCMKEILNEVSRIYCDDVSEEAIEPLLRNGCRNDSGKLAKIVRSIAERYAKNVMDIIVDNGFREGIVRLYVIGGGGCILKHFSDIEKLEGVMFIDDICANAKGYAFLTKQKIMSQHKGE